MERRSKVGGWAIAAVVGVVALFLYRVRLVLLPFLIAAAIGFVCAPVIDRVADRFRLPRWIAAMLAYVAILLLLAALGYWIAGLAFRDVVQVAGRAPQIIHHVIAEAIGGNSIELFGRQWTTDALTRQVIDSIKSFVGADALARLATVGVTVIFGGFLTLVLIAYFLVSGPRLVEGSLWLVPPEHRPAVWDLAVRITPVLRRYFVGLVAIVVYTATVAWIGFGVVFNLPHSILLAIAVGLLELIPVVGPITSATIVGIVAAQEHSIGTAVGLMGFAVALRLSIDQLVGPLVLGKSASVHPVIVIFAFLTGAVVFGIIGLILAVPVAASIKIILTHYYAEPIKR